jgi:hypothetical protein
MLLWPQFYYFNNCQGKTHVGVNNSLGSHKTYDKPTKLCVWIFMTQNSTHLQISKWQSKKNNMTWKTRGVSQCGLAISIKKYLKAKEESWKVNYFTMQKYNLQKIFLKKP